MKSLLFIVLAYTVSLGINEFIVHYYNLTDVIKYTPRENIIGVSSYLNRIIMMYKPYIYSILPNPNLDHNEYRTIELVLQVSNFYHVNSGIWEDIEIGNFENTQKLKTKRDFFDSLVFGILLIMALYHFALYFLRRDEYSTLFFGIFTLFMFLRGTATGSRFLLDLFPSMSVFVIVKIEYLSVYANMTFLGAFFYFLFPKDFNKRIIQISGIVTIIFASIIIFAPMTFFTSLRDFFNIFVLLLGLYISYYALVKAVIKKRQGSVLAFIGMFVFFGSGILDIITVMFVLPLPLVAPYGLVFYIFSQSFIISQRFSIAFKENKELTETLDYQNKNLEKIVKERTVEISQQSEEILAQQEELIVINDELQNTNDELEKLSIVASKTDNAIVILDNEMNFEWTNEGFDKLFGFTLNELIEERGNNFIEANSDKNVKKIIQKCVSNKETVIFNDLTKTKSKGDVWTQTTLTPIINEFDKISKVIAIYSDISKLKEAEQEILQKNEEITAQKDELEDKNDKIAFQNEHIKSSINYARTIQRAILPQRKIFNVFETFIIFKPKDVVSGDFYWSSLVENKTSNSFDKKMRFLAAVDCTGHGVPGAFMSMIGSSLLNQIVNEKQIYSPKEILKNLHKNVQTALSQKETDNNDGMDVALCRIEREDENNVKIIFSGAKRPLIYCKNNENEIQVIKGDRKSIGGVKNHRNKVYFTNKELFLTKEEKFYLTSDGYIDQNNLERKRFGTKRLLRLLKSHKTKPMTEQKNEIIAALNMWQNDEEQRDDITIIGVEI